MLNLQQVRNKINQSNATLLKQPSVYPATARMLSMSIKLFTRNSSFQALNICDLQHVCAKILWWRWQL